MYTLQNGIGYYFLIVIDISECWNRWEGKRQIDVSLCQIRKQSYQEHKMHTNKERRTGFEHISWNRGRGRILWTWRLSIQAWIIADCRAFASCGYRLGKCELQLPKVVSVNANDAALPSAVLCAFHRGDRAKEVRAISPWRRSQPERQGSFCAKALLSTCCVPLVDVAISDI